MLNQCAFIGNMGQDPETKYMQNGNAVTNISVGVTEKWKDKSSGEMQERTEWVRGSAFGKLAEIIAKWGTKGQQVYISGRMQTRKYQAQDGSDRYATDINIQEFKMLGRREGGQSNSQPAQPQSQPVGGNQAQPMADDFDDDIPF